MVKDSRKAILVALTMAALLAACAPAPQTSPEQVQAQVATQVAATVKSQNDMAAAVVETMTAQAPVPSATPSVTPIALSLPTDATVTPFVVTPPSAGSSGGVSDPPTAKYSCSWREVKPRFNVFSPGDAIDVEWVITNTGTQKWYQGLDLDYNNGTKMSPFVAMELPPLKPGDSVTVKFEANAPAKNGLYGMQFKVQGGLCYPTLNIQVGPKKDP